MSIWLYTGTPGSGKSYHAARDIVARLRCGGGLICNFPVDETAVKRCRTKVDYWDNSELTAQRLWAYAKENLKIGKEGQCLVVIDECQIIFNSRDYNRKDRMAWIQLFCQHRKLGFNFILITQNDRMIDRQIRALVENEVKHRKLNNYGIGGKIFSLFTLGKTWFIAIDYWYGGNKLKLGQQIFPYNRRFEKVYDSYRLFSDMTDGAAEGEAGDTTGCPEGRGPGVAPAPLPAASEPEEKEAEKRMGYEVYRNQLFAALDKATSISPGASGFVDCYDWEAIFDFIKNWVPSEEMEVAADEAAALAADQADGELGAASSVLSDEVAQAEMSGGVTCGGL